MPPRWTRPRRRFGRASSGSRLGRASEPPYLWQMLRMRPRRPANLPAPCQPTSAAKPPSGPGWIHEIKYDGYRMMAVRADGSARLITRNGYDWAARYPLVLAAVNALWARSCIIDGELAKCDERGLPIFDLLRSGPRAKTDVVLFAFDL